MRHKGRRDLKGGRRISFWWTKLKRTPMIYSTCKIWRKMMATFLKYTISVSNSGTNNNSNKRVKSLSRKSVSINRRVYRNARGSGLSCRASSETMHPLRRRCHLNGRIQVQFRIWIWLLKRVQRNLGLT